MLEQTAQTTSITDSDAASTAGLEIHVRPRRAAPHPQLCHSDADDAVLERILDRMHTGDREAIAEFIAIFGNELRRRIARRLRIRSGNHVNQAEFDVDDLFATATRRLDATVLNRTLRARRACELWALMGVIIDNAVIDAARSARRTHDLYERRMEFARCRLESAATAPAEAGEVSTYITSAIALLRTDDERHLLRLWLNDVPWTVVAEQLGISHQCVRKRWEAVRRRLREHWVDSAA